MKLKMLKRGMDALNPLTLVLTQYAQRLLFGLGEGEGDECLLKGGVSFRSARESNC